MSGETRRFAEGLALVRATPRRDRAALDRFRDQRLRELVRHAAAHVPRYRRLFADHGIDPGSIRSVADLPRIPVSTRMEMQSASPGDLVVDGVDPEGLVIHRTGGSTGRPLPIRRTWREEKLLGMFRVRAMRMYGLRASDRRASVNMSDSYAYNDRHIPWRILQALGFYRKAVVDCRLPATEIAAGLAELNPRQVSGYPGAITRAAEVVTPDQQERIRPRFITTGAEVLTPEMRSRIEQGFGAPVYDTYGAHEFNLVAWECPETGEFHVCDDGMILEVLDDDGQPVAEGERGEVVGTNLHSFAMPIIRYRLADLVVRGASTCACGLPFSTIRNIIGRMNDQFVLPDGRTLHPYALSLRLSEVAAAWVSRRQAVQERVDRVVIRLAISREPTDQELADVRRVASEVLGPDVETVVEPVDDIEPEGNGKFRVWKSLVASNYTEYDDPPARPES